MIKPNCVKLSWTGEYFLRSRKPHFYIRKGKWVFYYQSLWFNEKQSIESRKKSIDHIKKLNAQEAQNVIIETITN